MSMITSAMSPSVATVFTVPLIQPSPLDGQGPTAGRWNTQLDPGVQHPRPLLTAHLLLFTKQQLEAPVPAIGRWNRIFQSNKRWPDYCFIGWCVGPTPC